MHRERKLRALRDALGDEGWQKSDEVIFFCKNPRGCNGEHHKRKLSVNLKTDAFHCWVCGWGNRSSIEPILRLKNGSEYYTEYVGEHKQKEAPKAKEYDKVVLPKEFRPLSVTHRSPWYNQAMAYLAKRGLGHSDVVRYKLGYCEDGPYKNRIIIPSFDEYGELNFVVGRSFYDNDMKYKHGEYSKDIIFNDYMVNWSKPIVLVEGPFDMMKVGQNAIPLQGTALQQSSKLFKKILEKRAEVYIALDNDAEKNRAKIIDMMLRSNVDLNVVSWSGFKDPGDMPKGTFKNFMYRAMRISSAFDALKYKVFNSASLR